MGTAARPFMLATICVAMCLQSGAVCEDRPNVIFIVVDDLGYGELSCYGGRDVATPHIDSLAKHGIRFTSGYVTAPFCAASRAALLTGRYQTRFGFEFNPIGAMNSDPTIGLPVDQRTLADLLREAGYATALIGKWHLGGTARFHPQRRGFDEFFGFLHEGHYYVPPPWNGHVTWLRRKTLPNGLSGRWISPDQRSIWSTHMGNSEPAYDTDNPLLRSSQPIDEQSNLTDAFTREAEQFVARHRAQPFFLLLSFNAVHSPLQGMDTYLEKFVHIENIHRRIFVSMLAHLDASVGRLLARVRDEGLEDRTLIVLLSDNGGPTRELTSSNAPLRGEKGQLLEGGIRVPLLAQWKGRLTAGHVESRMVSALDLFPTALAAADIRIPELLDGSNLLTKLSSSQKEPLRHRHYWRLGGQAALREGAWKIYRSRSDQAWQLVNVDEDPSEQINLAASHPVRVAALVSTWQKFNSEMVAPLWPAQGRTAK